VEIQQGKIMMWAAISIILLSTGLLSHVIVLPILLGVAGRDAWISFIIAAPIFIAWFIFYTKLSKKLNNVPFYEWSRQHWGLIPSWVVKICIVIILFFNGMYTLLDTAMWTVTTYLQETPFFVITLCTLLICIALSISGLQSIGIVASILFPMVASLGYFVKFSNIKHKDYSLLLPIFEHGYYPTYAGVIVILSSLMDIWIIIFFSHRLKKKNSPIQNIIFCIFLLSLVIGPLTGSISEFGIVEASKQRDPAFEQWKILSVGQFLQHVDFLSIYQWLSGSIIRISISLYLIVDLFNLKKQKHKNIFYVAVAACIMFILLLPWREEFGFHILQHYYFPALLIFVLVFTLLIWITISLTKNKEESNDGTTSH